MNSFLSTPTLIVLLGLLVSSASAAPKKLAKRSFRIDRVRNKHFRGHDGPRQLLKTYRKYQMSIPNDLVDAVVNHVSQPGPGKPEPLYRRWFSKSTKPSSSPGTDSTSISAAKAADYGLVNATPELGDIEFLSPITIGGQTINVDFDSGSADLWVFSTQLPAHSAAGHQLYDHSKSKTFKLLPNETFNIKYGDGSGAAGNVGTDTVQVGGVTVTSQAVEMATFVSSAFVDDAPNNGLLGLAFSSLNQVKPTKQKTFFENLMPHLAEPVWTADLRRNRVGAYEFGRIDASKIGQSELAWIPSNTTQGFWSFSTAGYKVGDYRDAALDKLEGGGVATAIADTGTTLMLVAKEVAEAYYEQVEGAKHMPHLGGMTFPCDVKLPDLWVDVGGAYAARIKGEDINFSNLGGNLCYGGVQPTVSKQQIWGNVFFRSQFVVFHGGNSSLGMAPHA
ncbi:penicillopepsin [Cladorrhinum samala]|uniref:Penicillopepsin n=1 Tax=Cladorrhinum samala TaxID=585594 RepID=A0AAV9HYF0_9PEZI|nr:penicillopepsin [Cladorrhinum samala]